MPRLRLDPMSPSGVSFVPEVVESTRKQRIINYPRAQRLNDLSDVLVATTPSDNQALAWDDATQKFIPQTLSGGGGGGSTAWGDITGTLSNQTDLQAALDRQANNIIAMAIAL